MKNYPSFHPIVAGLTSVVFSMAGISCRTTTPPSADVPKTVTRSHWVKVSSHPPIYYPRGVAANTPTDHWSGEWVHTGDQHGTRYFIPLRNLGVSMDRQMLVKEALSQRSERKLAVIAAEDDEILARNIRNMALFGPPTYAGLLLAAMGGASAANVDIHRLGKEWHTSKESD